jgi:hypothetical protein
MLCTEVVDAIVDEYGDLKNAALLLLSWLFCETIDDGIGLLTALKEG